MSTYTTDCERARRHFHEVCSRLITENDDTVSHIFLHTSAKYRIILEEVINFWCNTSDEARKFIPATITLKSSPYIILVDPVSF